MSDDYSERALEWMRDNQELMRENQAKAKAHDFSCHDCGCDTRDEYYTVHDDLWLDAGMPLGFGGGLLCIGCLEARIGRRLRASDFINAPVNWSPRGKSGRLLERLVDLR